MFVLPQHGHAQLVIKIVLIMFYPYVLFYSCFVIYEYILSVWRHYNK